MKLFVLIFILVYSCNIDAQFYTDVYIEPLHPTSVDSVFVIDTGVLPYLSMSLYYNNVIRNSNNFVISQCYNRGGGAAQPKVVGEKTPLGVLPSGAYWGILYYHSQYDPSDTDCSQYGIRDSIRFSFTVTEPTSLSEITELDLTITPNPNSGKLYLSHYSGDAKISITDLSGRVYNLPHTRREIDVSGLTAGVYMLRLQSREGSVARRFVKE